MRKERSEPEWTAENQNKERGSTTFEMCGWCEHIGSGSFRYNCAVDADCDLLSDYDPDRERGWDSKCYVKMLGTDDIADIIRSKRHSIEEAENRITRLQKEIAILGGIDAPVKPPLSDRRNYDYYNVGDVIYVFHEQKWNRGIVAKGYRHHDGCVSYVLDDYPESQKGWGCGCAVPCVLKEWEYNHFRKHPDDFDIWLKLSDREYNGRGIDLGAYKAGMKVEEEVSVS